ncbi:HU family DNA-binding protein [Butyricimonas faecalis]|nr:HU family DNA-binding protein [Butyricimonas faecalis]
MIMNKRELTKKVAERSGHTQATSALIINTFISCILESLEAGEKVTIQDFGTLAVKQQKTRERFNLITKKVEKYDSYDYIKFITSKSLKNKQKARSLEAKK